MGKSKECLRYVEKKHKNILKIFVKLKRIDFDLVWGF